MTLAQMTRVKRWLRLHGRHHPAELYAWDLVLTTWVLGGMAVPVTMLLDEAFLLPLCLLAFCLPTLYSDWRSRLHRCGRLRCDWLTAL